MSGYSTYEILGGAGDNLALVLKVRNLDTVIKQSSALAAVALSAAPESVAQTAYGAIREELLPALKAKGIDADIQISSAPPYGAVSKKDLVTGVVIGGVSVGGGLLLWKFLKPLITKLVTR